MSEQDVEAVLNALIADDDLLIDFWTPVEKAINRADVMTFTDADRTALLRLMADRSEQEVEHPIFKHFL